jgi:hypothetical protein
VQTGSVTRLRYFAKKPTEECDAFFKRKCDMIGEQVMARDCAACWQHCLTLVLLQLGRLEKQMFSTKNKMDNVDAVLQQRMRR